MSQLARPCGELNVEGCGSQLALAAEQGGSVPVSVRLLLPDLAGELAWRPQRQHLTAD